MALQLESKFGDSGRFTEQDPETENPKEHYWQPELPSAVGCAAEDDDGLDIEDDERLAMRKEVFKIRAKMQADKTMIFGYVLSSLSEDSQDVVKRHVDWDLCNQERCPAHLWQVIIETHATRADNCAPVVRMQNTRESYNKVKQFGNESLVMFRERFKGAYEAYCLTGNAALDDEVTAMDFFNGLGDQHVEFKRMVKNQFASGEKEAYADLMAVFVHVNAYIPSKPVGSYQVSRNATVYHTREISGNATVYHNRDSSGKSSGGRSGKGKSGQSSNGGQSSSNPARDMSKVKCFGCDEYGHYKNKCPKNRVLCVARVLSTTKGLLDKCSGMKWYEVVLDSGATISVMNKSVLCDVVPCEPILINGVTATPLKINLKGSLGGMIDAYCSDLVTGNILSLHEVRGKYKVTYDDVSNNFKVYYDPNNYILFGERHGLYVADVRKAVSRPSENVLSVAMSDTSEIDEDSEEMPSLLNCDSSLDSDSEFDKPNRCNQEYSNDPFALFNTVGVSGVSISNDVNYCSSDRASECYTDNQDYDQDFECGDIDDQDQEDRTLCDSLNGWVLPEDRPISQHMATLQWGFHSFDREKQLDGWEPMVDNTVVKWGEVASVREDLQYGGSRFERLVDPVEDSQEPIRLFHIRHENDATGPVENVVLATVYSPKQLKRAEAARKLLHQAGYPSYLELQKMVRSNDFEGSDVTAHDVAIASKVYGTPYASVRGKFTKKAVTSREVDPTCLDQPRDQILSADVIYVSGQPFLIGLASPLCLLVANAVKNETAETFQQALFQMFAVLRTGGFEVTKVEMEPACSMASWNITLVM